MPSTLVGSLGDEIVVVVHGYLLKITVSELSVHRQTYEVQDFGGFTNTYDAGHSTVTLRGDLISMSKVTKEQKAALAPDAPTPDELRSKRKIDLE